VTLVAIAGGGASGALVAANLLRLGGPDLEVVVIEPRAELGPGIAYSTLDPWHRLNVPAVGMSALADDPDHFVRWSGTAPEAFLPRIEYGRYLREVLAESVAASPARLRHAQSVVERVQPVEGGGVRVTLASGEQLTADAFVLATGVELPPRLAYLEPFAGDERVIFDPWKVGGLGAIQDGHEIVILGSSLTAIDVTGTILNAHPRARVVALSRHGRLPMAHEDPWRPRFAEPVFSAEEFFAADSPFEFALARVQARGDDWPRAVDSLRPISQQLWIAMDDNLRAQFLATYRNRWDTHRHRVAPEIARDLDRWKAAGRFAVSAVTIERVESVGERLRIVAVEGSWEVDRIVVAVGPDPDASASPLLGAAIGDGLMRRGSMGISIDVDPATGAVLDARGESPLPIYAMGALRKGALWETLAIPEIRTQAADVARRVLADAQ
jgi:uncharacterized NAD(P)/FAD-binding protein YdhS